jgi:hypothetical protein
MPCWLVLILLDPLQRMKTNRWLVFSYFLLGSATVAFRTIVL